MRLYYKPDSAADIPPVKLEFEERTYTHGEALEVWRKKGCESSASAKIIYCFADPSK